MKKLTFTLCAFFFLGLLNPAVSQDLLEYDESQFEETPELVMIAPPIDTTNAPQVSEYLTYSNGGSDRSYTLSWQVNQACFWGGTVEIWVYQVINNVDIQIYHTKQSIGYLGGWQSTTGWTFYPGPNKSVDWKLVRRDVGTWCDSWRTMYVTAKTEPLKAPTIVTATNASSDKFVNLSWTNASDNTPQFQIFKDNNLIATVSGASYQVSNIPAKTDVNHTWGVRAVYGGEYSSVVNKTAYVYAYKKPYNLAVSQDTTIGYVRMAWACVSDYATHFRIYRDGQLLDTIPFSQKSYLDYKAIPGRGYNYYVVSYNNISGLESDPSETRFGRAVYFDASDGKKDGKVIISWTKFPDGFENELRLYRDGDEVPGVFSGQTSKDDEDAVPGELHEYTLDVRKNGQQVLTISDYGFAPANGRIDGMVTTATGGGVKDIEVRTFPGNKQLSYALSLDGMDDYMVVPRLNKNINTLSLAAWVKRTGNGDDFDGLMVYRSAENAFGLHIMANGELRYNWADIPETFNWASGLIIPANEWTFIALTVNPDSAVLYVNDSSAVNTVAHPEITFDDEMDIGRDPADTSRYFLGNLDEIYLWDITRDAEQVKTDKHHIMRGDEDNLIAFWRFNRGSGNVAGDYAMNGNHHGILHGDPVWSADTPEIWHYDLTDDHGYFYIRRIFWGEGADFTITPFREGHGFRPVEMVKPVNSDKWQWDTADGIKFVDTTSIEVSGWVMLDSDPQCPKPGVEILVNDKTTSIFTDSLGHFSVTVGEQGNYKITPEFTGHGFTPPDTTLNLQDAVTDLVFLDTTTHVINGKMVGACDNFLGVASIRIASLVSDCIDTTLFTDEQGLYSITLPAQSYTVRLVDIEHADRITIINYFQTDTVDITYQDSTHNIIYHSPPQIAINGLPDPGCGIIDVPILEQEVTYAVKVEVFEQFGEVQCAAEIATITFEDHVAYSNPDSSMQIENGHLYYPLRPGYPNLTGGGPHPYQKMLVIRTDMDKYTRYDTVWVFIRGQKPREFQFSTVSPEIPLMILHDPPGDQSYSYLSKTTSASVNIGFSFESEIGVGVFANFKVGGGGDIPGVGSTGAWVGGNVEANVGIRSTMSGSQEIKISATEMLKTSDSDVITGSSGDVFMGAALNILYAKTDILDFDAQNCIVVRDTGIVWNGNGFKTTYLYTESYIRESVIPGLQSMAAILNSSGEKAKQDSAEVLLNQAGVWQQVLDYNAIIKQNAVPVPEFPDNISFSAGTNISEEATVTSTSTLSVGLNLFIDASVALSIGAKVGDFNEGEAGVKIFAKLDIGMSSSITQEITNTIGFELADDDADPPGDAFTVDIKGDPVYGTPVFDLLAGTSSCPWEHPTLPREGVGLTMNTFQLTNIPPEMPASFDLYLSNLGQNEETRTYLLSVVQGSNPDGAIISVGGAVMGDDKLSFPLESNLDNPQRATLRVRREAGSVFDYDKLQVHLYSECDAQFDTTVTFSVHFIKPCSDVLITQPADNWVMNTGSDSILTIVLKNYDIANQEMTELKFEYRLSGTNDWLELFSYARTLLPADSVRYDWDLSAIPEGNFELRALTLCPAGTFYTRTYHGISDFTPPVAFGNPEPADGMLDAGDDIMLEMSEDINPLSATKKNISLVNLSKLLSIDVEIVCKDDKLVITPANPDDLIEGDSLRVYISELYDMNGNNIAEPISWNFVVNIISLLPEADQPKIPTEFALDQNYPNPFNPETTIRFAIPKAEQVSLVIYNINGQVVSIPVQEKLVPGYYNVTFDGRYLSSGVYFYRIQAGKFKQTKKLILLK